MKRDDAIRVIEEMKKFDTLFPNGFTYKEGDNYVVVTHREVYQALSLALECLKNRPTKLNIFNILVNQPPMTSDMDIAEKIAQAYKKER